MNPPLNDLLQIHALDSEGYIARVTLAHQLAQADFEEGTPDFCKWHVRYTNLLIGSSDPYVKLITGWPKAQRLKIINAMIKMGAPLDGEPPNERS